MTAAASAMAPPAGSVDQLLALSAADMVGVDAMIVARMQSPVAVIRPEEFRPGPSLTTEADLRRAAAQMCSTIFHPAGTAAMGADGDAVAVLDERMRVRGVERLRVIDASAMPRLVSGNTNAPTIMMAEKGAAMVIEDARA